MQDNSFKPLESAHLLVVGDIILDQYIYGETNRISPEAPVPVVKVNNTEERPGGAANVAVNISSLDIAVKLLGVTGQDDASSRLESILKERNVESHFIYESGFPTITKRRVLSQHQQLIRLDYEDDSELIDTDSLLAQYKQLLTEVSAIVLSDYAKGSLVRVQEFISLANEKNIPVLVDPKSDDFSCYRGATVLTPNQKELERVVGKCDTTEQVIEKATRLCKEIELDALLVTRGEKGMILIRENQEPFLLSAETHEVYDVTGAGDTVISVLAAAMACNYSIEDATYLSNLAAGIVVEKLGAATVSVDELNNKKNNRFDSNGIVDQHTASELLNNARNNNEKIVMTNGCFDILHAGHVSYLNKARRLGDRLIIAVNDDESVKRLKGKERPINPLENRMFVLDALASVDWVVSFSEDTPAQLIESLQPDVLVKGGDYKEDDIAGAEHVKKNGGQVVVLPFEQGHSTSQMLEKIKN